MQGQLGENLVADLIREIAKNKASGLLRLSRGKTIKAIFFESGAPVYAISNLTNEQIDYKLVHEGLATPEQVQQAKQQCGKANRLGSALVEMGALTSEAMRKAVCDQIMEIILSLFEWNQGDYAFDERIRTSHDAVIELSAADIILKGARHAAEIPHIAAAILPQDAVVVRARVDLSSGDTGKLLPLESYVLSRIEFPTAASEVGSLTGIPDEEATKAVCALASVGLLRLVGANKDDESEKEEADARLREEISRKLHFYNSADFYEVLEVTRQATTGEIKAAYYQLAKKFHPDCYRQSEEADLRGKLEALFARITQSYETLSQPALRAAYDDRIRKPSSSGAKTQPLQADFIPPAEARSAAAGENRRGSQPLTGGAIKNPAEAPSAAEAQPVTVNNAAPGLSAEQLYQQGRARYERKEYHAAVHLLREAAKLDPSRPHYHYHLGVALIRNARTRHEAEQHLMKAAELDPYNAQIRVKLGLLYKEVGLPKRSAQYFREALSMDPDNKVARREIGGGEKKEMGSLWKSDLGTIAKRIFKR